MKHALHKPPANPGWEKAVVINDIQIPFQDDQALSLAMRFIAWFKPDLVFLNGDIIDLYRASKYESHPAIGKKIREEVEDTSAFLSRLRASVGSACRIIWIYGNHEYRLESYIVGHARELYGMKFMTLAEQVEAKKYNIEIVYSGLRESYYKYGDLYIGHFDKAQKHSPYTAKALVDEKGANIIQAHTQRLGSHFRTLINGKIVGGWENGCLCKIRKFHFTENPNWQHGFSIVWKKKNNGRFHVEQIPIIDYKFFYGGIEWT